MKTFVRLSLAICTSLMLAMISPAFSQTPDGLTPAVEDVCDPLTNATPGLYGLCVAFCEAHDADLIASHGDLDEPRMPDRRILDKYNSKKKESDPPMPCVLERSGDDPLEECPCWTAVQLEEMMPPLYNRDYMHANACNKSAWSGTLVNYENGADGPAFELTVSPDDRVCMVRQLNGYTLGAPTNALFGLTTEEATACAALFENHARKYSIAGDDGVWDCFDQ